MRSAIIIGSMTRDACDSVSQELKELTADTVVRLSVQDLSEVGRARQELFGLRLTSTTGRAMAFSGWVFTRYTQACLEIGFDPSACVALHNGDGFGVLTQFGITNPTTLFLGSGRQGKALLLVILEAAARFGEQQGFNRDGYLEEAGS